MFMAEKDEYISLKKAAELSGYSADYIGQLIRSGKLHGKQVYLNVAWMTTERDIVNYMNKEAGKGIRRGHWAERAMSPEFLSKVQRVVAWGAMGFIAFFIIILFYVLSVSIDHAINRTYQERALQEISREL